MELVSRQSPVKRWRQTAFKLLRRWKWFSLETYFSHVFQIVLKLMIIFQHFSSLKAWAWVDHVSKDRLWRRFQETLHPSNKAWIRSSSKITLDRGWVRYYLLNRTEWNCMWVNWEIVCLLKQNSWGGWSTWDWFTLQFSRTKRAPRDFKLIIITTLASLRSTLRSIDRPSNQT